MRKVLFWMHLAAGVTCGIVILIMCVMGAALAGSFGVQRLDQARG